VCFVLGIGCFDQNTLGAIPNMKHYIPNTRAKSKCFYSLQDHQCSIFLTLAKRSCLDTSNIFAYKTAPEKQKPEDYSALSGLKVIGIAPRR
jgi:hypothetical protein